MQTSTDRAHTSTSDGPLPPGWWRATRDEVAYTAAVERLRSPMTFLALVFTGGLLIELAWELSPPAELLVRLVNVAIWAAFAVEYLWLLRLAPDRWRFVRTHALDLIIVLLPVLRPLRALRLVRVLAAAVRSWHQVFSVLRHRGLGKVISSVGALMLVGGLITFLLEPETFTTVGDAIWWVLVTSTTVGYGDFAPVGAGARVVAAIIMLLGIGLVGVITANIVDFLSTEATGDTRADAAPATGDVTELVETSASPDPATHHRSRSAEHAEDEALTAPFCAHCAEVTARLTRIESQLQALLAHRTSGALSDPVQQAGGRPEDTSG